ncbi:MAG: hypothetical protein WKG00_12100 [Polyangiaceae bacterium]
MDIADAARVVREAPGPGLGADRPDHQEAEAEVLHDRGGPGLHVDPRTEPDGPGEADAEELEGQHRRRQPVAEEAKHPAAQRRARLDLEEPQGQPAPLLGRHPEQERLEEGVVGPVGHRAGILERQTG